jgi:hypothetical protein
MNTPTVKAENVSPVRCGTLGIGHPLPARSNLGPYETLAELTRRSGHAFELLHAAHGWFVWNETVGDSAGEGSTREEALEAAMENI